MFDLFDDYIEMCEEKQHIIQVGGGESSVQHPVDHLVLPFRKGILGMGFPERDFVEDGFRLKKRDRI